MKARYVIPAALVFAAAAWGQAASPNAVSLIESLRSPDWHQRQEAEDALVAIGNDAVEAIQTTLKRADLDFESRERLQSALARIDQERRLLATPVTVAREFGSPLEAFAYLAECVGLQVEPQSEQVAERARAAGPVELELNEVGWLAAVDQLTARTGIATETFDLKLRLLDETPESLRPPTHYAGSAAITALGARKRETLQFGNNNRRGDVYLNLAVELEPKATLVDASARLVIRRITDEGGQVVRHEQVVGLSRRGTSRFVANLTLGAPDKLPPAIGTFEGELHGELITRVEQVRITDLTTLPHTVELPDGEIEITGLQTDDKGTSLAIVVPSFVANRAASVKLAQGEIEGLQVLDQDDKPMRMSRGPIQHRAGAREYRFGLTGDDPADVPSSITWSVPSQTRDVRIPFKLENLPLPQ